MKKFLSTLIAAIMMIVCLPLNMLKIDAVQAQNSIKRYTVLLMDVANEVSFMNEHGQIIYTADTAITYVKKSAQKFLTALDNASGENHVAVIAYADNINLVSGFTTDISSVKTKVNALTNEDGFSDIHIALSKANDLLNNITIEDAVKNVVLVTTGMDNAGSYNYIGVYDEDTVGSEWQRMDTEVYLYAYANEAVKVAATVKKQATLYVLGLFQTMSEVPEEGKSAASFFRRTARDIASPSQFYEVENPDELEFAFGSVVQNITACEGKFKYRGQINKTGNSTAKYHYSDTYFLEDSSDYNRSLATMSLCMELACWPAYTSFDQLNVIEKTQNVDRGWYKGETEDSSEFWRDEDHLRNIKELFYGSSDKAEENPGIGFSHFKANDCWKQIPTADSIGVCAARKQIKDNDGTIYTLVALPIRGGGYGSEWASNFKIGISGEHEGFKEARDNVLAFLKDYLEELQPDESRNIKLWITGYSRAGATANLVAGALDDNLSLPNGCTTTLKDIYCYTFEAPQGAVKSSLPSYNNPYVNTDYKNIHNIINLNDIVPLVAPSKWDFARYNYQKDHILPCAYAANGFFSARLNMFKELNKLGFGPNNWDDKELGYDKYDLNYSNSYDFDYKIKELTTTTILHWEKKHNKIVLISGLPSFYWTSQTKDTCIILSETMDSLADNLVGSRKYFNENMQQAFYELFNFICNYNGIVYGKAEHDIDTFEKLKELFTIDSIIYIIAPMFEIDASIDPIERQNKCLHRLQLKLNSSFGTINVLSDGLYDILKKLIIEIALDSAAGNTETISKTLQVFSAEILQPHFPEITLAWVRSQDPYYNTEEVETINSSASRIIRINCPVDVEVYDSNNNLRAAIRCNKSDDSITNSLVCYVNENGEKIVYLPGDETYDVRITATDDGEVNYSISEIDIRLNENTRLENYYNIPVKTGDILNANVSAIAEDELKQSSPDGSSAVYTLDKNGSKLNADEVIKGVENIAKAKYDVTLKTEGNGGYAYGAGRSYLKGSFAQMGVSIYPNGEFLGWYDGNELISSDPDYRFAVKNNTELTAKFNELEFRSFTPDIDGKGTINQEEGFFPADFEIELKAEPDEGYEFVNWTSSNGGTFDNDKNSETVFIMPDYDTKVIAHFRMIGDQITSTTSTTTTTTTISTTTTKESDTTTTTTQHNNILKLGDVNSDDQIDAVDASIVLAYYARLSTNKDDNFNESQKVAAEVNGDGQINAVDASNILAYYAYLSTTNEDILSLKEYIKKKY